MPKRISIKSTYRPVLLTTPSRSKTMIIGGKIYEVNGEPWNEPYVAIMPGGVITLDDIDWIDPRESQAPISQNRTWTVGSSDGQSIYLVREESDGRLTCNCSGFHYRRKCRHLEEVI